LIDDDNADSKLSKLGSPKPPESPTTPTKPQPGVDDGWYPFGCGAVAPIAASYFFAH
jgi:hypothetical protein